MEKPKTQENLKRLAELKDSIKQLDAQQRLVAVLLYQKLEWILAKDEETEIFVKEQSRIKNEKIATETERVDFLVSGQSQPFKEELERWKEEHEPEYQIEEKREYPPIKDYWHKYLKNNDYFVHEHDDEILSHLTNISMGNYFSEDKNYEKISLYFQFEENRFFKNKELSLSVSYTNDYVEKSVGTVIDWVANPTVKYLKRRQKNKRTGEQRIVNQKIQEKSFFQLFENYEDEAQFDEKSQEKSQEEEHGELNLYLLDDLVQDIKRTLPYSLESYLGVFDDYYDSKTVSVISEEKEDELDEEEEKDKWNKP